MTTATQLDGKRSVLSAASDQSSRANLPAPMTREPSSPAGWDRLLRARMGRLSPGLSPPGLLLVTLDLLIHLGFSPGKQRDEPWTPRYNA
jgi:hypothetical protein